MSNIEKYAADAKKKKETKNKEKAKVARELKKKKETAAEEKRLKKATEEAEKKAKLKNSENENAEDKPKRRRRTKAEIEADKAAREQKKRLKTMERENDKSFKEKKVKKIKQTFSVYDCFYETSTLVYRVIDADGNFNDIVREFRFPITFNKAYKINNRTKYDGQTYVIKDIILNEKDLVFQVEIAV